MIKFSWKLQLWVQMARKNNNFLRPYIELHRNVPSSEPLEAGWSGANYSFAVTRWLILINSNPCYLLATATAAVCNQPRAERALQLPFASSSAIRSFFHQQTGPADFMVATKTRSRPVKGSVWNAPIKYTARNTWYKRLRTIRPDVSVTVGSCHSLLEICW